MWCTRELVRTARRRACLSSLPTFNTRINAPVYGFYHTPNPTARQPFQARTSNHDRSSHSSQETTPFAPNVIMRKIRATRSKQELISLIYDPLCEENLDTGHFEVAAERASFQTLMELHGRMKELRLTPGNRFLIHCISNAPHNEAAENACVALVYENPEFPINAYQTLSNELAKRGMSPSIEKMIAIMEERGHTIRVTMCNIYLKSLGKEHLADRIEPFLQWMAARSIVPDSYTYSTVIAAYTASRQFPQARTVLQQLVERYETSRDVEVHTFSFVPLARAYPNHSHEFPHLLELVDLVVKYAHQVDTPTVFRDIIRRLLARKRWSKACQVLHRLPTEHRDVALYNCLLVHVIRGGTGQDTTHEEEEGEAMQEEEFESDGETEEEDTRAQSEEERKEQVQELMERMEVDGVEPDLLLYTTLLRYYFTQGYMQEFHATLDRLLESNIALDEEVYRWIVRSHLQADRHNDLLEIVHSNEAPLLAQVTVYNRIIRDLVAKHRLDDAYDVLDVMTARHIPRDFGTYKPFLEDLTVQEDMSGIHELIQRMAADRLRGPQVTDKVFAVLCSMGSAPALQRTLQMKRQMGHPMTVDFYETITRLMREKSGRIQEAQYRVLLEESETDQLRMSYSWFEQVAVDLAKAEQLLPAMRVLADDMGQRGLYCSLRTMQFIISRLRSQRGAIAALELMKGIVLARLHKIPGPVLAGLLDAVMKQQQFPMIGEILEAMRSNGRELTLDVYNSLVRGYAMHGQVAEAFDLFEQMDRQGVSRNAHSYHSLWERLTKDHNEAGLVRLRRMAKADGLDATAIEDYLRNAYRL